MADTLAGTEVLTLADDFPPVSTEAWEAAIHTDLNGADYDKKLVWREEGIAVRPYYRRQDVADLGALPGGAKPWSGEAGTASRPQAIRADVLHEAGATAVQELGYALAEGVERLAADSAMREIEFVFAVGSTFFFEIAKLRAARLLWANAVDAFGPEASCRMRIHVRTSRRNKSILDPYTNLLRATTEALSAVIGGCDQVTVEAFGFEEHLAENVSRILAEEAHLNVTADPAGGAYLVEVLTDSIAREAWKVFQEVEAAGGYTAARGAIEEALAKTRAEREKAIALRRRTMVGVNNYPNLAEKSPALNVPASGHRLAEAFEKIRLATERQARTPRVLLLTRGDRKMRMPRANFSLNFFGCAGFEIEESADLDGKQADLIVLCSSDPEYLDFARDVCPRVRVPVLVAGNPKDQIEALRAAGIQGFIHLQSDAVKTLTEWQKRLGIV